MQVIHWPLSLPGSVRVVCGSFCDIPDGKIFQEESEQGLNLLYPADEIKLTRPPPPFSPADKICLWQG